MIDSLAEAETLSGHATTPLGVPEGAAILHAVASGDAARFDAFVDCHKGPLFAFAARRLADPHAAEDVVQEAFLRAFRSVRRTRWSGGNVRAWLFAICRSVLVDHLRRRAARPDLTGSRAVEADGDELPDSAAGPPEAVSWAEGEARAAALLARLPDEQQEVVTLRVYGELTFAAIAEVTGAPLATVKSRMRYGLARLAELLPPAEL